MRVLVIGGNRFVGPLLVWRLLARGDAVTLLNRGSVADPFGDAVERLRGDRRQSLASLVGNREFEGVVDLAAYDEADATTSVTALAGHVGHYLAVSTGQVYLVREGCPRPATERDYDGAVITRPTNDHDLGNWEYGVGKRACEDALARAHDESGFPATRLRIPMVNGERDYFRRLEGYLWRLVDGGPVLIPDGGAHPVRHVYAGEVARWITAHLGVARTIGRAFNLAQRETPTLLELLALARELLGSRAALVPVPAERLRQAGLEPRELSPFSGRWMSFIDPSLGERELGFVHEPLASYLGKIVASFVAHTPADRPPAYARRAAERALAAREHPC